MTTASFASISPSPSPLPSGAPRTVTTYASSWLEESLAYTSVFNFSATLDLPYDHLNQEEQMIGVRFTNMNIPKLSEIKNVWVRFSTYSVSYFPVTLRIWAERSGNPRSFAHANYSELTNKMRTAAFVDWSVPEWTIEDETSVAQTTPDLSSIFQEIVTLSDWQPNNPINMIISRSPLDSGDNYRVAHSGKYGLYPYLNVDFVTNNPQTALDNTLKLVSFVSKFLRFVFFGFLTL
jgi:hypothetical protein